MGTWELGGREWGDVGEEEAISLLRYARERGVTFYDTADQYGRGRVEELLGQAFSDVHDDVVIATKVGLEIDSDGWLSSGGRRPQFDPSPVYVRKAVEDSLRRLDRERLDICQFHSMPSDDQWDDAFETMEQLTAEGKVGFYGVCPWTAEHALKAMRETGISMMLLTYNMLDQSMAEEVLPAAQAEGIAVVGRQPLASGLLSGHLTPATVFAENDYRNTWPREQFLKDLGKGDDIRAIVGDATSTLPQAALKFILAHPAVSCVVPGMMTQSQIDDGAATSDLSPLPQDVLKQLQEIS